MRADPRKHGRQPLVAGVADDWAAHRGGEPRLDELMEDPMMGLIWRRDGLEPVQARATLRELQSIVRASRQATCG